MAKTIKFNLVLDGNQIRNIEMLRENFVIEEIISYYRSGLLARWLNVRGYEEEYKALSSISGKADDETVLKTLITVFKMGVDEKNIEKAIYILKYNNERTAMIYEQSKNAEKVNGVIKDYHSRYDAFLKRIEEHADDWDKLKADVRIFEEEFMGLFNFNCSQVYLDIKKVSEKAIFAFLSHAAFRDVWINKESIARSIFQMRLEEVLNDDLKVVERSTSGVWDSIERPGTKIMPLYITDSAFIRNADDKKYFTEKLSSNDVNGKFIVLDGLAFQSNDSKAKVVYVEV